MIKKIFLVDDNEDWLVCGTEMFRHLGFEVISFKSSLAAFPEIKTQRPHAIFSDIMMPGQDGLDFLKQILTLKNPPPVVLVTANSSLTNAIQALRLGALDYLLKPITLNGIKTCLIRLEKHLAMHDQVDKEKEAKLKSILSLEYKKMHEEALRKRNDELEVLNEQLKEQQKQLLQSEKMATLGQLAAGIAHEINNPTSFIKSNFGTLEEYLETFKKLFKAYEELETKLHKESQGYPEYLAIKTIKEDEDIADILDDTGMILKESMEGTERIQNIVSDLKGFSRIDSNEAAPFDLNKCIESAINISYNELKYKCTIERNLSPLPKIQGYGGQVLQVLVNLLVNASHAIEKKGQIFINTSQENGHLLLKVKDTGKGIPQENLEKIFDPFFTTKPKGKGTGLGLFISQGIMEKHNGQIQVESEVGRGTTFTLLFPENEFHS